MGKIGDGTYALGGFNGTNFLNIVEIFDPCGRAWMLV
jgi:hypothetical protein